MVVTARHSRVVTRGEFASNEQAEALRSIPSGLNRRGHPGKRTDILLVAMAQNHIVVTNNSKEGHWRLNLEGKGRVIQWTGIEVRLRNGANFAETLRTSLIDPALLG